MLKAQRAIIALQSEIGLSDSFIARVCEVTRKHISEVKRGKSGASYKLTKVLEDLLEHCREQGYQPPRKPYTRRVVSKPKVVRANPLQDMQRLPEVSSPAMARTGKYLCQSCQSGKGTAFYGVLGGWYCGACARAYGQVVPR